MAKIETLQKRVDGAQKNLDTLNKKLQRIRKVESQNWEDPNPYYYSKRDLECCLRDIDEAETKLAGYKAQLEGETKKSMSRNVPAIVEFLNMWRDRCREYYMDSEFGIRAYFDELAEVVALRFNYSDEAKAKQIQFRHKRSGYYEERTYTNRWGRQVTQAVKVRDGEYEFISRYMEENIERAEAHLMSDLNEEWNRKYDDIINRTVDLIGTITDASCLSVDARGNLNGYIKGENGTAKVETIGAGGYNIQCFHFRTLIHKVN